MKFTTSAAVNPQHTAAADHDRDAMRRRDEHVCRIFSRDAHEYLSLELNAAEQMLLGRFRESWHEMDVLDLGVGAGRTAYTFAPLCRSYVGVDFSERMIELCRERIGENERVRFVLGDARDLSCVAEDRFDLAMFSYNGIDYVSHDERIQILREVRRLLRPEGLFFFSSHSLAAYPFEVALPAPTLRQPLRWIRNIAHGIIPAIRLMMVNRRHDPGELNARGWAVLQDGTHGFSLDTYHITPEYQTEQLSAAGFETVGVYDGKAAPIDPRRPPRDSWLHYLARLCSLATGWFHSLAAELDVWRVTILV